MSTEIEKELKRIGDDVKSMAETAQKEIKAHAALSEETKAKVDQLLTQQGELRANLQNAEQKLAMLEQGGGNAERPKSLGEQFTEADGFEEWARSPNARFRVGVNAAITSDSGSAGDLIQPTRVPGVVAAPNQRLRIRDLLTWGRTTSNSIEYVKETGFTNAAAVVAENPSNAKPESGIVFDAASAPVVTIAHWLHATKQVLADIPMLQSYINNRLIYGLKLVEDRQLLKGSGVGLNINGLYTQATNYVNPGVTVANETAIDRLRLAILQAELAEYDADGIVLSPVDWTGIELTKTTDNAYLFANPRGVATPGLWGRTVVTTQAMDAGDFLVGAFAQAAQGWDREDVSVQIATQDQDDFVKNMVKILVEERIGLTVFRPEALVKGEFAAAPASSTPPASS